MMRLLKEHLFYIVLIGSVLVIGGALAAVSISLSGDVEQRWEQRQDLIRDLSRFAHGNPVNQQILNNRKRYVENIKNAANAVKSQAEEFNRSNYQIIRFDLPDGKKVNAFPMDRDLYQKYDLTFSLTKKYINQLNSLRNSLKPVPAWTEEKLKEETESWEKKLQQLKEMEGYTTGERRAEATVSPSGRGDRTGRGRIPTVARGAEAEGEKDVPEWTRYTAQELAAMSLKLSNASKGMVYVSEEALNPVFISPRPNAMPETCWDAQIQLWVLGDIIGAINDTNQQALRSEGTTIKKPNVMNAAVKRLVEVRDISYFQTETTVGREARASGIGSGTSQVGSAAFAANLTQRSGCRQYDVIHYTFTVIMPSRHVLDLQQSLMSRNYHTILQWDQSSITKDETRKQDIYYYGTEPVMEITIEGELLLLSSWERNLMPIEVLRNRVNPSALRPQDIERLKDAGYETTMRTPG